MTTQETTATGDDLVVGGDTLPRKVRGATLAVPASAGDTIELQITASAEVGGGPVLLDCWVLDSAGRDRRALSGAPSPGGLADLAIPARSSDPVELVHRFEVRDHDPVDGVVHLQLVATSHVVLRKLHIATSPLTLAASVLEEGADR